MNTHSSSHCLLAGGSSVISVESDVIDSGGAEVAGREGSEGRMSKSVSWSAIWRVAARRLAVKQNSAHHATERAGCTHPVPHFHEKLATTVLSATAQFQCDMCTSI